MLFDSLENGAVEFRGENCTVNTQPTAMTRNNSGPRPCEIEHKDFSASFDGERWTVVWNWTTGPPTLKNKVGCY